MDARLYIGLAYLYWIFCFVLVQPLPGRKCSAHWRSYEKDRFRLPDEFTRLITIRLQRKVSGHAGVKLVGCEIHAHAGDQTWEFPSRTLLEPKNYQKS